MIRCSLPINLCRGQAFDGASNMSGVRNGVQALVKREVSRALYVHCFAHSLNLCIQEASKQCSLLHNAMQVVYDLVQLIKFSPKRLALFDSLRKEVSVQSGGEILSPSLRTLCPTRWTVRTGSLESVLSNYSLIQKALSEIQQGSDEYAAKGRGLLSKLESFDFFFGVKLGVLVFSSSEQFSSNLQAKNITVQEATRGADLLHSRMKSLRKNEKFDLFFDEVKSQSSSLTEEPILPRYRKAPKRYDDGSNPHQYQTPKDRYRHAYFEVLDVIAGELERRFDQPDIKIMSDIEQLILRASNNEGFDISDTISKYLEQDINCTRLKCQLSMLPDLSIQ